MRIHDISKKGVMAMFGKRTVLFVDSICGEPDARPIGLDFRILRDKLSEKDYRLVVLRDILDGIPPEVLSYAFPGIEEPDAFSVLRRIHILMPESFGETGLAWTDRSGQHFLKLSRFGEAVAGLPDLIDSFVDRLEPKPEPKPKMEPKPELELEAKPKKAEQKKESGPKPVLDERTREILTEIKSIRKKFGISLDELDIILGYEAKPGRLVISCTGKITLPDFGDKEVKLDQLSKAVYFLFLRHPEGIRFKELCDMKDELLDIYLWMTVKEDMDAIRRSIDSLVDPTSNSINEKVSRIKSAFRDAVSDRIAKFYYIDGPGGGRKTIALDRNLVSFRV